MERVSDVMLVGGSGKRAVRGRWLPPVRGGLGALIAASVLVAAGPTGGGASIAAAGDAGGQECDPEVLLLPAPNETAGSFVSAINDNGLVVGTVSDFAQGVPPRAVMWTGMEPPTELGIGGIQRADGSWISGAAVDVNEAGVVAVQRLVFSPRNRVRSSAALLWDEVNRASTLPVPAQRRKATVTSLNDQGVAVGSVRGPHRPQVPVYWRGGELTRLPLPRSADTGLALDNNNRGLIVGHVFAGSEFRPWWWRRGGRNGPLSLHGLRSAAGVVAVDDHDRVVGHRRSVFLWRSPSARPRQMFDAVQVAAMDDSRHLVGFDGDRGGDNAWVARLGDAGLTVLPNPPLEDPADQWVGTFAWAVASGVTAFAPQGGLTVAGSALPGGGPSRAALWTCAQTYLE